MKYDLRSEVTVDIDFEEDFLDRYGEDIGTFIKEEKQTGDSTSHIVESTILALRQEQRVDQLCQGLSRLSSIPKEP